MFWSLFWSLILTVLFIIMEPFQSCLGLIYLLINFFQYCESTSRFPCDLSLANNKSDFWRLITRWRHFTGVTFPLWENLVIVLLHQFRIRCLRLKIMQVNIGNALFCTTKVSISRFETELTQKIFFKHNWKYTIFEDHFKMYNIWRVVNSQQIF